MGRKTQKRRDKSIALYEDRVREILQLEDKLGYGRTNPDIIAQLSGRGLDTKEIRFRGNGEQARTGKLVVQVSERNLAAINNKLFSQYAVSIRSLQNRLIDKFGFVSDGQCPICDFPLDSVSQPLPLNSNPYELILGKNSLVCTICGLPLIFDSEFSIMSFKHDGTALKVDEIGVIVCEGYIPMSPIDFIPIGRRIYQAYRATDGELDARGVEHLNHAADMYLRRKSKEIKEEDAIIDEGAQVPLLAAAATQPSLPSAEGEL